MNTLDDGSRTTLALQEWMSEVDFAGLGTDLVQARIIDEVAAWAETSGWRVYRRAPSVFPLPPPLSGSSVIDVACARPDGPPVAVEVDRLDRQRTVDKLLAEAAAGRVAIWVRWGAGPFDPPPLPVHLVTREAARIKGTWHTATDDRPAPPHTAMPPQAADPEELPW